MATIEIPDDVNKKLDFYISKLNLSKTHVINQVLKEYLYDLEDAEIAHARMNNPNKKFYTTEELLERLKKKHPNETSSIDV